MGTWIPGPGATEGDDVYVEDHAGTGPFPVNAGAGNDRMEGGDGYDRFQGGAGNDVLLGGGSSDFLEGGEGDDLIDGGGSLGGQEPDYAVYENAAAGVVVDLAIAGPQNTIGAGVDTIVNIESVLGSAFADTIYGDANSNAIEAFDGNDTVFGRAGDDAIWGFLGNDVLDGGDGHDQLYGYDGDDTIRAGSGNDTAWGEQGDDTLYGEDGDDWLALGSGTNFEEGFSEFADGGAGNDRIDGSQSPDELYGGLGNDTIIGAFGADFIDGGEGDDTIDLIEWTSPAYQWPDWITDTCFAGAGDDFIRIGYGDTVDGGADGPLGDSALLSLENPFSIFTPALLDLRGYDPAVQFVLPSGGSIVGVEHIVEIYLTWGADTIYDTSDGAYIDGGAGNDVIHGLGGDDIINGNGNDDFIDGGDGNDDVFGSMGDDVIHGGAGADSLEGWLGNDLVDGGDGDDVIWIDSINSMYGEPAQIDIIHGGAGIDTITFWGLANGNTSPIGVTFSLAETGPQRITMGPLRDFGTITADGVENVAGTWWNDTLTGNDAVNYIYGDSGSDALYGMGGDDVLDGGEGGQTSDLIDGGAGVDTVAYQTHEWSGGVTVSLLNPGTNIGAAQGDTYISVENILGSFYDDVISGDNNANTLWGDAGNDRLIGEKGGDVLDGGAGADSISGGDGDDVINYNFGDGVDASIDGGAGTDRIVTFGNAGGETLDVRWTGTGFTFWKGSNVVGVEQGVADMGGGVDWLRNHNSNVGVSVNLALGTATGFISIANIENAWGSAFADTLTGSAVANIIRGGAGDDQIDGGADNDTLVGDDGIDTILGGAGADAIYGLSGGDIINAGDDNDTIYYSFGEGVDAIDGGLGTDTIICQGNSGAETLEVIWNGASFTFFKGGAVASIEQASVDMGLGGDWLRYSGSSASISINLSANTASGFTSIANIENAGGGSGADTITGSAVANNLIGNDGADQIDGAAGNDTLNGGAGADRLTGGADSDTLTGGTDADTFVFATGSGADSINDFDADAAGGQDFIDLSGYGITAVDFAARVTIADQGANTLITIDGINTIILHGVTGDGANLVTQGDFILGP